jgi:two-component system sensor histidine kinase KdpD
VTATLHVRQAAGWALVLAATTAVLLPFRSELDKAHISLVLLLVVLGAGAAGGRILGLLAAAASFLLFDWFFLPPYGTLTVTNPLDWVVLIAFLVTSVVAAQLLHREQESAQRARELTREVDRLATLGAEALSAPRAEEALAAVVAAIRSTMAMDVCGAYLTDTAGARLVAVSPSDAPDSAVPPLVDWVGREGAPAAELDDGTSRLGSPGVAPRTLTQPAGPLVRALLIPLGVRGQTVGVLRVAGRGIATLDDARWRFLDALAFYAALGAERVRLAAEVAHIEALRDADRLKDALIASVSHDLRTPLTTIKALAHDLGALGDERSQVIEEQADRLNRFVGDLLDLSRLSAGALHPRIEVNAVDDLLSAAVQETEGRFAGRTLQVELPSDGELLVGRFDLALSVRVLVNLIENAYKYSPPDSPVTVSVRREHGRLLVRVADCGPGVPVGEEQRIFSPFYRLPNTAPDVGSAGLGLAIAKRMAEAQGGSLTYTRRAAGGSTFTLALVAAEIRDAARAAATFTKS